MRVFSISAVLFFVLLMSCEKCKRCSYSYTKTIIIQTVNGEEEQTTTFSGYYLQYEGKTLDSECIKGDEKFTIEDHYKLKGDTTVLDNYEYNCVDL